MDVTLQNKISTALIKYDRIKFVVLFGSSLKNKTRYGSDIDIAIYFDNTPEILEIGSIANELEIITENKVDLVELNNLAEKDPGLAHSILCTGKILFIKDKLLFNSFKKAAILNYLDFKYISDHFEAAFRTRLSTNRFAVFDKNDK
jgi:predicted nucleotidyltransferase